LTLWDSFVTISLEVEKIFEKEGRVEKFLKTVLLGTFAVHLFVNISIIMYVYIFR